MQAPPQQAAPELDDIAKLGRFISRPFMRGEPLFGAAEVGAKLRRDYVSALTTVGAGAFWMVPGAVLLLAALAGMWWAFWQWFPWSWVVWPGAVLSGLGVIMLVVGGFELRAVRRTALAVAEAEKGRVNDPIYRDVEAIRSERMSLEQELFTQNLHDDFSVDSFKWRGIDLFEDGGYNLAPHVNVLLGKNGYGKTLLFRTLVATLQRDAERSALLFPKRPGQGASPLLTASVRRNGEYEEISRDSTYFRDPPDQRAVGKIPVLAIPDSRFINRSRGLISGTSSHEEGLAAGGASNFLAQLPFENVVEDLLTHLCHEFIDTPARRSNPRRAFERGIFRLVEQVIAELTEEPTFQFAAINRVGTKFEMLVQTNGRENPEIPIQAASQGTLSVVAIFGVIYRFLHSLRPNLREEDVCLVQAIVVIDEVDAHLHPVWQQKIVGMLTKRFPNVQFILSAHSPLIVAGCDRNEVSVLRKREDTGRLYIMTLQEDFLGAQAEDLYRRIFNVEQPDRLYLEYSAKTPKQLEAHDAKIAKLQGLEELTQEQEELLAWLSRERRLIGRAEEVREQRMRETRAEAQISMLDAEVARLRYDLAERNAELEALRMAQTGRAVGPANAVP